MLSYAFGHTLAPDPVPLVIMVPSSNFCAAHRRLTASTSVRHLLPAARVAAPCMKRRSFKLSLIYLPVNHY
jgi:hypothetical protein